MDWNIEKISCVVWLVASRCSPLSTVTVFKFVLLLLFFKKFVVDTRNRNELMMLGCSTSTVFECKSLNSRSYRC